KLSFSRKAHIMRGWLLAGSVGALICAGCSTAPQTAPAQPAPGDTAAPAPAPAAGGAQAQGVEWEQLLEKLRKSYEVNQAAMSSQADEHYRLAERYYQAGD